MKNVSRYIDLAFCLLVLPVMAIIFPIERWFHNFQWYVITVGVWLYLLYFLNRVVTVPSLFHAGVRRVSGIAIIIASIAVTYYLSQINSQSLEFDTTGGVADKPLQPQAKHS